MRTNIETIYRQHIKPLAPEERLKLLAKMAEGLANGEEKIETPEKRSLLELEGLGAEIWEGVDAQKYVDEMRDEWERRP